MNQKFHIAQEVLQEILEQHLFLFADPMNETVIPSNDVPYLKVRMGFCGDLNGHFILLFPEVTSKEVTANVLGLDLDSPEVLNMNASDAASEIMNVIGAKIVSRLLIEQGHFEVEVPKTEKFDHLYWPQFMEDNHLISFSINGNALFFQMIIY